MSRGWFARVVLLVSALSLAPRTAVAQSQCAVDAPGVRDPQTLARLMTGVPHDKGLRVARVSYLNYNDLAPRLKSIKLAAYQPMETTVGDATGSAQQRLVEFVTSSYFDVLGVPIQAGRAFTTAADAVADQALEAVISDALWQSLFNREASAVGKTVSINGRAVTIIGVAGPDYRGIMGAVAPSALWLRGVTLPLVVEHAIASARDRSMGGYYEFVARQTPGTTWAQASQELASTTAWLREQYPAENGKFAEVGFHLTSAPFCAGR
jgi:putative ABC transport system permease protein